MTFPYDDGRISSQPVVDHTLISPRDHDRAKRLDRAWENGPTIFGGASICSGLTEIVFTLKDEDYRDDGSDRATNALWQVWSASQALLVDNDLTRIMELDHEHAITRIIVPVIVTGAQLWEARLNEAGQPVVREVAYTRVRTPSTGNAVLVHVMKPERFAASPVTWPHSRIETTPRGDLAALTNADDLRRPPTRVEDRGRLLPHVPH
ncbi:MAG TPA: hypothetical protein VIT65_13410 [Microlunatus sp.]